MTIPMPDTRRAVESGNSRQVISASFLLTVVILTCLFFGLFIPYLNNWQAWLVLLISIVPVYSVIYNRVLYVKGWFLHRGELFTPPRAQPASTDLPGLAFIIPSCSEPFDVAKMTFDCAYRVRYTGAREIIVVDNSKNADHDDFQMWKAYVESHAGLDERIRVVFHHNTDGSGSKAGNVDRAQTLIETSKYVMLLDIDSSLPMKSEFLDTAIRKFESDPELGILQFYCAPANGHFNRFTRAGAITQLGYRTRELIRSSGGFTTFDGHNGIWRRSLLEQNGSWQDYYRGNLMVTEDVLKTVNAHTKGFKSEYMPVPTGEWVATSLDSFNSMWMRWTYGGFQVLFKYFRAIMSTKGLSPTQRTDLISMVACHATTPLIYPVAFLWFAVLPPAQAALMTFVIIFLTPLLYIGLYLRHNSSAVRLPLLKRLWDHYAGLFVIEVFVSMVQLRSSFNFFVGKKQGWRVTAKSGEERPRVREVLLNNKYMLTISALAIGAVIAIWGWRGEFDVNTLVYYSVLALIPVNLLLCVIVFGGQVQPADETGADATIDRVVGNV